MLTTQSNWKHKQYKLQWKSYNYHTFRNGISLHEQSRKHCQYVLTVAIYITHIILHKHSPMSCTTVKLLSPRGEMYHEVIRFNLGENKFKTPCHVILLQQESKENVFSPTDKP